MRSRSDHWPVLVVLAAAVVLAGCGGVTPASPAASPTPTPTLTPQEQALAWTSSVCEALVPVATQLTRPPRLDVNAPAATKDAYSAYLAQSLVVTDRAREALAAAGPAPVEGGDAIAEQVLGDVADLRASLVDAKNQVDKVNPADPIAGAQTLIGAGSVVVALLSGAKVVGTLNHDPALSAAYKQAPSCDELQRAGAPATSSPLPVPPPTPTR
jgi:hypothetical protein